VGVITAIEPQKRKKDRLNVFVDGEFAVGLSPEIVFKEGLKVGQRISSPKLKKLIKENELDKVLNKVYKFLSYRPRSEKEITDYLFKKKANPFLTALVIETLKRQKYLDDREFALWWVEQRLKFHPVGKHVLRKELFKKGINKEIVDEVVSCQLSVVSLRNLALKIAQKRALRYKADPTELRRKMGSFLARRGFDWETIKEVVDKIQQG